MYNTHGRDLKLAAIRLWEANLLDLRDILNF